MRKSRNSGQTHPIQCLDRAFFSRDPRQVARHLLGKVLVREEEKKEEEGEEESRRTARIVEVEAYLGTEDPAAHAAAGNTARTAVLFGPPGHAYVYFIYGNHYCLNVSCEPEGRAGSVLIRALEPLSGVEQMAHVRGIEIHGPNDLLSKDLLKKDLLKKDLLKLTSGPGRLAQAFGITRVRDNGCDLTSAASSLWIGDDGYRAHGIRLTPRIGITKAPDKKLRYVLVGNAFVSGPKMLRR
jgi:DNA-3-methyladenine glycosylase